MLRSALLARSLVHSGPSNPASGRGLSVLSVIPSYIQHGIEFIHNASGAPWWVAIVGTTVAVRLSLLPLYRKQIMISEKFSLAFRDMMGVTHVFSNHVKQQAAQTATPVPRVLMRELPQWLRSINDVNTIHNTSFSSVILPTVFNAGLFITFVMSVRWMMTDPRYAQALHAGGAFWFQDLTFKDKYIYLPFAASLINYVSLDLFFPRNSSTDFALKVKDGIQMLIIVSFSAIVSLPSGVFMYWIPSGLFTIGQRYLFTNSTSRRWLGMAPMQLPPLPEAGGPGSTSESGPDVNSPLTEKKS